MNKFRIILELLLLIVSIILFILQDYEQSITIILFAIYFNISKDD